MKLQLWTTDDNNDPDELLGEINVDDDEWRSAQTWGADARELICALAKAAI